MVSFFMAAAADYFKQVSRRWVSQIGSGGVSDGTTTTIPLASTTNLPTGTGVVVVVDRVDSNGTSTPSLEETITGVVSGSNLVSCTRGVEGTAQAHDAGAVVEVLVTASYLNDFSTGILVQHDQAGRHTNITASNLTASGTSTLPTITASGTATLSHVSACDITPRNIFNPSGVPVKFDAKYGAIQADTIASSTVNVNMAVSNLHSITLVSAVNASIVLSNAQVGQAFAIRFLQPSAGSSGVAQFPGSTIKWAGGAAPTLTTTNAKADWVGFLTTAASAYDGVVIGQNI